MRAHCNQANEAPTERLAARLEAAGLNELMQRFRWEVWNQPHEERRVQQPREPIVDVGHGPAMIPILASNKQS